MKTLVCAPVRQDEKVFQYYLKSLDNLEGSFDRYFLLHNSPDLKKYLNFNEYQEYFSSNEYSYLKHQWNSFNLTDVCKMKNILLKKALEEEYDYIFLVDSDTILHPKTLTHLIGRKKDIVGEILWTKWPGSNNFSPNLWDQDFNHIKMVSQNSSTNFDESTIKFIGEKLGEINKKLNKNLKKDALKKLSKYYYENVMGAEQLVKFVNTVYREKGIFKVGGVGGCNLISRKVIEAGVNYNPIYNLSFSNWEDRAFCIRAAVLGFQIYIDTYYPAIHLYDKKCIQNYERSIQS